ncbi:hypothetical protein [Streptomyces paromomycinus]|uniref:DNA primase/polymerase bifunctional N-terminal domain-containing protein n=1 Tax=Streptomyces paromomycinus TaxID=92743 RepID=A0A401W8D1_STREY|nr:hypothetical protein [Streptomyces paromomycinus]GCD45598.1 hypothetical protein GKJPGBOP_05334 [Streptomyces paromomycinus]
MSDWPSEHPRRPAPAAFHTAAYVTLAGADWLASADPCPESVHARWASCPEAPSTLPCGTVFDVINAPALFGRDLVDRLWTAGPGSGPVATHRGRILLFAEPGTARRLPALLGWEEWSGSVPPLLCHGPGDAVTIPPLFPQRPPQSDPPHAPHSGQDLTASRWLVAPDVRHPWLPGPGALLWACIRAARRATTVAAAAPDGAVATAARDSPDALAEPTTTRTAPTLTPPL